MTTLFADQMLALFTILAVGALLGSFSWRGISLGTAGVLFVALVFGNYGISVPKVVMDLGLLLFVYAVGLQAGPRFFRLFRKQGLRYVIIGVAVALTGALATLELAFALKLPDDLATGLYTGALTCTPALAAALDVFARMFPSTNAAVSVGYGIAYPFSMIGVVLLVQFLPRLLKRDLRKEEQNWLAERQKEMPSLVVKQLLITNQNMDGKSLRELDPHRLAHVNITRVRRDDQVSMVKPDFILHLGDVVMVVGPQSEMEKIKLVLGEETEVPMDMNASIATQDLELNSARFVGKTLAELQVWENYGVIITRIRRQGLEISPVGSMILEIGDGLHLVGDREEVKEFIQKAGGDTRKAEETNMLPYLLGLVLGIGLGLIPFHLATGVDVKLGTAGGAFLVSLLIAHFGRIGPLRLNVPAAAKNLTRELGLMLFLAGAGTTAGAQLVQVIQKQGWSLLLAGAVITIISVVVGLFLTIKVFKLETLGTLGALTAAMTNPPGLAAANNQTATDQATLAYASVYPAALIFKILFAQILVTLLLRF
ncbi:MAG: aspartate:alanine exchanger family transporter [Anaerolineales bacterium]|jgi:putative transport protein